MKFWLVAAAMLVGMSAMAPEMALAQGAKKNTCPGGKAACIQRCISKGGQPRGCPLWCEKRAGC